MPTDTMGLATRAKHPASGTVGHHDNCSQSAMNGIKTTVADSESGRSRVPKSTPTSPISKSDDGH